MHLKAPHGLREQPCADKIQEACGHDQEDLQSELVPTFVDQEAYDETS